jgi:feruloyl esterase
MSVYRFLSTLAFVPGVLSAVFGDGASNCSTEHIPPPSFLGGQITSFTAASVTNYSIQATPGVFDQRQLNFTGLTFCNVTVVYTHQGWNDSIRTQIWLPTSDSWNGRFEGTGGGGFVAGYFDSALGPAVSGKYLIEVHNLSLTT